MKKKAFLAVLALCVVLSTGACAGGNKKETNEKQTEEADNKEAESAEEPEEDGEEKKEGTEEAEEKEQEDNSADKKTSSGDTRLVTVKDIDKYINIGEYKGLVLDKTVHEVTDEDIDSQIEYELSNNKEEVTDKNATVQDGDMATIDFVGTKDGVAFDGGTGYNYDVEIGSGSMVPGFEDGIIGMKKGETKEVPLTFPEGYGSEELSGADVVFKITLQNFRRTPELTEEWVKNNTDFTTIDEYKTDYRGKLEEYAALMAESEMYSNAWNMLLESSEIIEFPEEEINNCIAEYKKQVEVYAKQADMELMDFVISQGYTEESFEDECRQYAEYKVKQNLLVQSIMDAEGLSLDDEECLKIQQEFIDNYGVKDLAELIDKYGQVNVDESIGLLRVERFIVENAKVTEKVSNGEQVGVNGDAEDTSVDEAEDNAKEGEAAEPEEDSLEDEASEE